MNPEEPMLEYDTSSHHFRQDLIGGGVHVSDGKVRAPQNPGLARVVSVMGYEGSEVMTGSGGEVTTW
jgi:hypothetical protein